MGESVSRLGNCEPPCFGLRILNIFFASIARKIRVCPSQGKNPIRRASEAGGVRGRSACPEVPTEMAREKDSKLQVDVKVKPGSLSVAHNGGVATHRAEACCLCGACERKPASARTLKLNPHSHTRKRKTYPAFTTKNKHQLSWMGNLTPLEKKNKKRKRKRNRKTSTQGSEKL